MAKKKRARPIDIEIDKLTNSIELAATGQVFDTRIALVRANEARSIRKKDWLFDWRAEVADTHREVYRLTTEDEPEVIHGLVSVEEIHDHIHVHLIESARFNRGRNKKFNGVPGNLFAHACRLAFDRGYVGFVAFTAKTALIEHYKTSIGASVISGQLMQIEELAARKLVERYKL